MGDDIVGVGVTADFPIVGASDTVGPVTERIDGLADGRHVLAVVSVGDDFGVVYHTESPVELDDDVLFAEGLPAVGHVLCGDGLRFQILKLLSVVQV